MKRFLRGNMSAVLAGGMLAWLVLSGWGSSGAFGFDAPEGKRPPQKVDVLIEFQQTPGAAEENLVRGAGGQVRRTFWLIPTIAATLPEKAIDGLKNNPRITRIEPDGKVQAIDCHSGPAPTEQQLIDELERTWGVHHIGAGIVHAGSEDLGLIANRGAGIGVAVLDTGIFSGHGEFECIFVGGHNFVGNIGDFSDDNGHGTHVAGTIAAGRNGWGYVGAAPEVDLYALKTLDQNGSGNWSHVIAALEWCVEHNGTNPDDPILVTNHSYGASGNPGVQVRNAFDAAYDAGILHVAAAGNSGNPGGNNDSADYPARFESVIAVAATDDRDRRARWSSTGPDLELAAPGVAIWSTWYEGGFVQASGTSMASPHVAGVAALVFASNPGIDNDAVRAVLQETAIDIGPANQFGYGLVDAPEAVLAVQATGPPEPALLVQVEADPSTYLLGQHQTATLVVDVQDENGAPIDNLSAGSFVVELDGETVSVEVAVGPGSGSYTLSLNIEGLEQPDEYFVMVTVTDDRDPPVSGSGSTSFSILEAAFNVVVATDESSYVVGDETPALLTVVVADESDQAVTGLIAADFSTYMDGTPVDGVEFKDSGTPGIYTAELAIDHLGPGTYLVTVVVDDGTRAGSGDSGFAIVEPPSPGAGVFVDEVTYTTSGGRNNDRHLHIHVWLVDDQEQPVSDAVVSIDLYRDGSPFASGSGTTGGDGRVSFTLNNAPSGFWSTIVTDVDAGSLEWDGDTPPNGFLK
jgi:hypothetical protein